jgi:hypothetical protein
MSERAALKELDAEDVARMRAGERELHKTSAARFIKTGLDIEDAQ